MQLYHIGVFDKFCDLLQRLPIAEKTFNNSTIRIDCCSRYNSLRSSEIYRRTGEIHFHKCQAQQ